MNFPFIGVYAGTIHRTIKGNFGCDVPLFEIVDTYDLFFSSS